MSEPDYENSYGSYVGGESTEPEPITNATYLATITPPTAENIASPTPEILPESESVAEVMPESTSFPEGETVFSLSVTPEHPFGESLPEGEIGASPETSTEAHPFGESEVEPEIPSAEQGLPEGEPEGEPAGEPESAIQKWGFYQCTGYSNPLMAEPEAEPEGEGEPNTYGIGGGTYAEPPAPLLQSVNYEERGVYSTFAAVAAALIIFLNIAVLVAIARKPKQRRSLTYLIGLIAAFDLLGGLQFLWFSSFDLHLMYTHADMWILVMCGIWMLSMAPQIGGLIHFGLHLINEITLGAGNARFGTPKIILVMITVFVFPLALFIPPLAGWNCIGCVNPIGEQYCEKTCSIPIFPFTKDYVILMTVLLLLAVALAIGVYIHLHMVSSKKSSLTSKSGNGDTMCLSKTLLTVYIICTLPVAIVMIADYATVKCNPELINAFHATLFVSFLSNLVNPMVVFAELPSMRYALVGNGDNKLSESKSSGVNGAFSIEEPPHLDEKKVADEEAVSKI